MFGPRPYMLFYDCVDNLFVVRLVGYSSSLSNRFQKHILTDDDDNYQKTTLAALKRTKHTFW